MGFIAPKPKKPPPPPNAPVLAKDSPGAPESLPGFDGSLISTSPGGLKRKAQTAKVSLIGGY